MKNPVRPFLNRLIKLMGGITHEEFDSAIRGWRTRMDQIRAQHQLALNKAMAISVRAQDMIPKELEHMVGIVATSNPGLVAERVQDARDQVKAELLEHIGHYLHFEIVPDPEAGDSVEAKIYILVPAPKPEGGYTNG